jgi:excisionase family DNA binding protein
MVGLSGEYLTTRELAELLRIKERKVYDLAASGKVPCSRATGKLLFPRHAIEAWVARHSEGPAPEVSPRRPGVFLGSHDPLLEWALRESRSGLATFFDGSLDGIERFAKGEGVAAGMHLYVSDTGEWNAPLVQARFGRDPVVLVEFAWRDRGLIVAPGAEAGMRDVADLAGLRVVRRQAEAGSQTLLEHLLERAGLAASDVAFTAAARTETDAAIAVLEGRADAAFGLLGLARQLRLGFVPLVRERFDLLVERRSWFEPPLQRLAEFCRSAAFADKAAGLQGYEVAGFGRVHFNGS